MRKLFFILSFISCLLVFGQNINEEGSDDSMQQKLVEYSSKLRDATLETFNGKTIGNECFQIADILQRKLYDEKVEMPLNYQIIVRIALETFNVLNNPERVNYIELSKAIQACSKVETFYDLYFLIGAHESAIYFLGEDKNDLAELYFLYTLKAHHKVMGPNPTFISSSCRNNLIGLNLQKSDYDRAGGYCINFINDQKFIYGFGSKEYEDAVLLLNSMLPLMSDKGKVKKITDELLCEYENANHTDSPAYLELLTNRIYLAIDDKDVETVDRLFSNMQGKAAADDSDCIDLTKTILNFYYERGESTRLLKVYDEFFKAYEAGYIGVNELADVAVIFCSPAFDKNRADALYERVMARETPHDNINNKSCIATIIFNLGHTSEAYEISREVKRRLEESENNLDFNDFSAVPTMFVTLGDYEAAVACSKELIKNTEALNNPLYNDILIEEKQLLAALLNLQGNIRESLDVLQALLDSVNPEDANKHSISQGILETMTSAGRFRETILHADRILNQETDPDKIREILNLKATALVALIENSIEHSQEDRQTLGSTVEEINKIADTHYAVDPMVQTNKHLWNATLAYFDNDNNKMIENAERARSLLSSSDFNQYLGSSLLPTLSTFYIKAGQYDTALALIETEPYNPNEANIERWHRKRILSEIAWGKGEYEKAGDYYIQNCNEMVSLVKKQFLTLTSGERANYWQLFSRDIQDAGRFCSRIQGPSEFAGALYDLELFSKGLLLNSEHALWRAVEGSNDPELSEKYRRFVNLSHAAKKVQNQNADQTQHYAVAAAQLEKEILSECKAYSDYTNYLNTGWPEVQKALNEKDVAIEFVQYNDIDRTPHIGAVLVTPGLPKPVFISLGAEAEIAAAIESDFDGSSLWGPLSSYFQTDGRVFFSPAGYLHRLPIESCFEGNETDQNVALIRVSSTRTLLEPPHEKTLTEGECAVFGGIDYGDFDGNTSGKRSGDSFLDALPGTLAELDAISKLWPNKEGIATFKGKEASKENFLNMEHKNLTMLHIGTHGFFDLLPSEKRQSNNILLSSLAHSVNNDDPALRGSGLCFADFNYSVANSEVSSHPYQLTAEEISTLDLSNLQLGVLSACETGAGKVTGEGVFGLQRGFKLAGGKTLLMSLWKVDDAATQKLMTEFYHHIFNNNAGKYAALEAAKKAVRSNPEWSDPYYWAGFILLDALD